MLTRTFFARAPLAPGRFAPLPAGAVTARGEMRDRLIALRSGLLSRCESLFPHTGSKSAWFGGELASGMDAANVLEGALLTSSLLGDEELRRASLRLCDAVLSGQREDGSFGAEDESFAARGRMLRALVAAYSMTGDKRMLTFMLRYMKFLKDALETAPLSADEAMHVSDTMEAGVFLYNVTGQKAILSVLSTLMAQGADYTSLYSAFPYRTPVSRTLDDAELRRALAGEKEDGYAHHLLRTADAANLCEGLRASALCAVLTGSGKHLAAPEKGLARMNKSHGAVCGGITGDPLLAGAHPSRGVTAVSLCELAASLELLLSCPAGELAADQLDALMYNGVAAAFAPDLRSVQPIQQANQVRVSRDARFPLSGDTANLFSLEDSKTLCALLAAWPRFAASQWLLSRDDGLYAASYAPCQVRYRLAGAAVRLNVESRYPVSGSVRITVGLSQSAAFPLHLRIPSWAKGATAAIEGEIIPAQAGTILTINRQWNDGDELLLTLPMTVELLPGFHQAVSVARGPLRFAYVPAHDRTEGADGRVSLSAREGFGIALCRDAGLSAEETEDGVVLHASGVTVPAWGMRGRSCDQPPITVSEQGERVDVTLVPYAASPIRLSLFPLV
ncbi:MAG: glycoside hydrolase family 127 protein [Clostridiales bacterium]|nr:glycoside hydrolase family 127 protein [Clostridiales bacterium]